VDRPGEVAGAGDAGALAFVFEFTGATSAANAAAVQYYRDDDDACLDDGTGDDPVNRPYPGEATTDQRVKDGYVAYWKAHGAPSTLTFADLACNPGNSANLSASDYAALPPWKKTPFQGAFTSHGIHFFTTHDSDNGTAGVPVDEVDGQQWRYAIPESALTNWIGGDASKPNYALNVIAPLQPLAYPYGTTAPSVDVPEAPYALAVPAVMLACSASSWSVGAGPGRPEARWPGAAC
jgi:hypothetical protein